MAMIKQSVSSRILSQMETKTVNFAKHHAKYIIYYLYNQDVCAYIDFADIEHTETEHNSTV